MKLLLNSYSIVFLSLFYWEALLKGRVFSANSWRFQDFLSSFFAQQIYILVTLISQKLLGLPPIYLAIPLVFFAIWTMAQILYYIKFRTLVTLYTLGHGSGNGITFADQAIRLFLESFHWILASLLPMGLSIHALRHACEANLIVLVIGLICSILALTLIICFDTSILPLRELIFGRFVIETSLKRLGSAFVVFKELKEIEFAWRCQIRRYKPAKCASIPGADSKQLELGPGTKDRELEAISASISARPLESSNPFTGYFQGKNLIFITAESFSRFALHPDTTPQLLKMAEEGFKFNRYYNPLWGLSTLDGEYSLLQSQYPKAG
ncbi:MAG: hypothetical protein Q4P72_06335, partial [Eubacteriales bacterium]|nr:hypothetical protein [Eubacteriales bacterium]